MLHRSFDEFVFPIRGDGDGALHLVREFSAVDVLSCHGSSPD
jgi:hypothetical protein